RKYYLGVATITQDIADFMGSPYGQPIVTNAAMQFLFKQSPATIETVQKTFNLTDEEKYLLLESAVGSGLFFAGLKHVAIEVVASYTEDKLVTTKPEEILALRENTPEP
ncbi:MAG: conjugal transfer protein TraC, partial [Candidatus Terrybacteria bacterium]|nr:conjugal transfer protein TraC [Candidatus Terrybacteria bacterium]